MMMQGSETDDLRIREYFARREESAAAKMRRQAQAALQRFWRVLRHALLLAPLFMTSLLLLDLPLRVYDGLLGGQDSISPSNWLSWGETILALSFGVVICIVRCWGARHTGRVINIAWLITAAVTLALLFYLAPQISSGDLPGIRFMIGFFISWYAGQIVAIHIYDITRGGKWWRAPFYALLFGFGVQSMIYFVFIYGTNGNMQNVPWVNWMILDICIKIGLSLAFLPIYRSLRRSLRPHIGLGGA